MIRKEVHPDGVWHVELRRPDKRNALTNEMYLHLADTLREAQDAPEARALILSGQGGAFCAGNDLPEFATHWPQPPHGPVVRFLEALHRCDLPLIAVVQGPAIGVGATLLLHCDMVLAEADAFLQFPFLDLGITVEGGGSYLPLRLGYARAMEILLTGRRVYADEANALGLVTIVTDDGAAFDEALGLARIIASKPPVAVRAMKRLVRDFLSEVLLPRFEHEIDTINSLLA